MNEYICVAVPEAGLSESEPSRIEFQMKRYLAPVTWFKPRPALTVARTFAPIRNRNIFPLCSRDSSFTKNKQTFEPLS